MKRDEPAKVPTELIGTLMKNVLPWVFRNKFCSIPRDSLCMEGETP